MNKRFASRLIYAVAGATALLFHSNAQAGFFTVQVAQVVAVNNKDVIVQVLPGTGETRFSAAACPCRVVISRGDNGANNMLAVVLSAFALSREVTVQIDNPPSASAQLLQRVSVNAPTP